MQQKNSTNAIQVQSVRHEVRDLASAPRWVVDSKRLEPGRYNVAMPHKGCTSGCDAPAVEKKN